MIEKIDTTFLLSQDLINQAIKINEVINKVNDLLEVHPRIDESLKARRAFKSEWPEENRTAADLLDDRV